MCTAPLFARKQRTGTSTTLQGYSGGGLPVGSLPDHVVSFGLGHTVPHNQRRASDGRDALGRWAGPPGVAEAVAGLAADDREVRKLTPGRGEGTKLTLVGEIVAPVVHLAKFGLHGGGEGPVVDVGEELVHEKY